MGRKIAEGVGTVWVHAEKGPDMVSFAEGDDVPKWAADQMGDHCFDEDSDDSEAALADLSVKELKAEIARRNEGRAEEGQIQSESQKKDDLVAALEADDAASAGA